MLHCAAEAGSGQQGRAQGPGDRRAVTWPQERGGNNDRTETMPRISPYMGTQAGARGQI